MSSDILWKRHLSPEAYRELIAGVVQEINADAAAERKRTGRTPLGPDGESRIGRSF